MVCFLTKLNNEDSAMKKLFIVILATTFATAAVAHSGGTNSKGCHNDTKKGTYHCH